MHEKVTARTPWFFSQEEVLHALETSLKGLSEPEAKNRLDAFGFNTFASKSKLNIVRLALKQFSSPLIFILIGAAVLTAFLREWVNVAVIITAIVVNVVLGLYREYRAENTLDKLVTYIKDRSRALRDGHEQEIESSLLVPGDIINLSYGSRVPADARIISANNFRVDEAILTGESVPVAKKIDTLPESSLLADQVNMAHAGTLVTEGFATAVVTATGSDTEIGKIADVVSRTDRTPTPIQKGINALSWYIFIITIVVIVGIFFLGISRGEPLLQMLILSAAVAVGAVPESLPIALTVILSVGAERIAMHRGIIRKLAAAETLGSATLIMTDKTGTLTKADMQLVGIHTLDMFDLNDDDIEETILELSQKQKSVLTHALQNIDILVQNPADTESLWKFIGSPFEVSIAKASITHGIVLRDRMLGKNLLHIPFNSTNKFSVSKSDNTYTVMGAPDVLLKFAKISKNAYVHIESWIQTASNAGKRLVAIGNFYHHGEIPPGIDDIRNINFEGVLSFFDPVREEVPLSIKNIEAHGVRVVMITGDLKGTAISVAKSLGWSIADSEVLTGSDIHTMTDAELRQLLPHIKIYARVTPEDKLRIGKLYRELGEIVAMTGDGVNDAPALKSMDIGISLGTGSDVAKSAADLVLLDDNFKTISMAIDEGRRILSNVKKTFVYLMSNAFDEVFVIGGSLILGITLPLTALQIIWVNLFTGSLPALAFAFDEHIDKEIQHKKSKKKILTFETKVLSLGLGVISSLLLFFVYYGLLHFGVEIPVARSVFFVCFSVYILAVAFSFRSLHKPLFSYNPFSNRKLNSAILVAIIILIATMSIPFMRKTFDIAPMPLEWMWFIAVWIVINICLIECAKWLFRYRSNMLVHKHM